MSVETQTYTMPPEQDIAVPVHQDGVYVCALRYVEEMVDHVGASHLMTLINKDTIPDTPAAIDDSKHLKLGMNDIIEPKPELVLPNSSHVQEVIDFAQGWDRQSPMLVHCWAGISRSTAAAYTSLCVLNPDASEVDVARKMRDLSPTFYPNKLMIAIADEILNREGRMVDAINDLGRGRMAPEGVIFGLSSNLLIGD